ncbi:CDP-diacylglycerol--glycerol-3-phosphate 3-phosphatidyltransferase [Oscillospiraceae bacterium MB08-C2-2]|nr:CDP-diacylglycerol--glycerol-3-phosphate 3-phosphatidyltransferase [Oscillospiraceae bacterium MB08-C2-2]
MNLPNRLTVLRACLVPVFVWLYLTDHMLWALVVFATASLTDALDGRIARSRGLVTNFGKLMDPLADKVLVMSAMLCFVATDYAPVTAVILILAREFLVTSIRSIAASQGVVIAADIWGKLKTVAQMLWICVQLLSIGLTVTTTNAAGNMVTVTFSGLVFFLNGLAAVLLWAVVALSIFSAFHYIWKNRTLFGDM